MTPFDTQRLPGKGFEMRRFDDEDDFFKNGFQELTNAIPWQMKARWAAGVLVSLSLTGVFVWAIISLVQHITAG